MGTGSDIRRDPFHGGRQRLNLLAEPDVNVFAIRHGETAWNLNGQHTGKTDIPLTDNGRRLAAWMRPRMAAIQFCNLGELLRAHERFRRGAVE